MSKEMKAPDVDELLRSAQEDGLLSPGSLQSLEVVDVGAQIQAGLGVSVDQVAASEVLLVTMMPDDSGSIRFAGNTQAVRDGHNLVLEALEMSKQSDGILAHTRYLNGEVLFPYTPLDGAVKMDRKNYNPGLGTPLYDQTMVLLGTVLAKTQELADNGVPARSVTLLITDGDDQGSRKADTGDVAKLVADLLRAESHIVAAMGVDDGSTDFGKIFRAMGIPDEWILTPGNSAGEIRRAFQVFSQSAVRAASGAVPTPGASLGGFTLN